MTTPVGIVHVAGVAHRDQAGRVVVLGDVGEIEEPFEVPPGRLAPGREPGVVAVDVHGLLVVGDAGVLGTGLGLVQADVGAAECPLGEVDDGRVHDHPVERAGARKREDRHPPLLGRTEPRAVVGPDEDLLGLLRMPLPPFGHPLGVGMEVLGAREDLPEVLGQRVDLVGADEAVEEDPTVLAPGRRLRRQWHVVRSRVHHCSAYVTPSTWPDGWRERSTDSVPRLYVSSAGAT